ncbi:MAG: hypothetical protein KAS59_10085 [Alphaproteobacteria bacterium]|nr:hypothetical protein [Alphaproteobacteria bacterium]MCK5658889.1 hypothetical protein [Alphaproteobacteria bacterium]
MDTIISLSSLVTLVVGATLVHLSNRVLDKSRIKTKWIKIWADNFLECAEDYNDCSSKLTANMVLLGSLCKNKESNQDRINIKDDEIYSLWEQILLLEWELKRYAQFSSKNKKDFEKVLRTFHSLLSGLIEYYCRKDKTSDNPYNLEELRDAQHKYSKVVRNVHSELMNIKK